MRLTEFSYVQARLQARHGSSPNAATWQALEGSRTAAHYLALARSGPLARWIDGLDEASDAHRVERHLQACWTRQVGAVARWQPPRWQAATHWFGTLTALPLSDAAQSAGQAAARWLEQWHRLMPADAGDRALLQQPAVLLLPRLSGSGAGRRASVEPERRALLNLFRRHAASAVAVFAYLALSALDVERLRGGLVVRTLFEPAPAANPT